MKLKYSSKENEQESSSYIVFTPFKVKLNWLSRLNDLFEVNKKIDYKTSEISNDNLTTVSNYSETSSRSTRFSRISIFLNNGKKIFSKMSSSKTDLNSQFEKSLIEKLNKSKNEVEAMQALYLMWQNVKFCDLILVSNGREFLAHKVALAFFSQKYKNYFKSNPDFVSRIQLSNSTPKSIITVLNFIYKSEVNLNIKTIEDVLECAIELDVRSLLEISENCLVNLDKKYVLQVLQISKKYKLKQAYFRAYWYICSNFDQCIKQSYFVKLGSSVLADILSDETNRNETYALKRLLMWIYFNRDRYMPDRFVSLLQNIRFHKIDINDFDLILNENSFILQIPECLTWFKNSIKVHYDERKKINMKTRSSSAAPTHTHYESDFNDEQDDNEENTRLSRKLKKTNFKKPSFLTNNKKVFKISLN
ncbi:unnamed protein product [Brachionus calyciflorus]|uniref:BTB domain-containing protein n=1 Tax=Brachionus calyciflorus TaxID=104777 RepID=A0A813PBA0_9BILA|nr:unnamed protein product [Brachionus calyciflorus]